MKIIIKYTCIFNNINKYYKNICNYMNNMNHHHHLNNIFCSKYRQYNSDLYIYIAL